MIWFYFGVALAMLISGITVLIKPSLMKIVMGLVVEKELFFIPGVLEIGLGLGTLYFRDQTNLNWFIYLAGLMLFFDGMLYIIMSKRLREMYIWFLQIADQKIRSYGLFLLLLAIGYGLASIPK